MNTWPVQDAKARFSELLDACITEGPQMVSRQGTETAVLVPLSEWKRLQSAARPSLKALLLRAEDAMIAATAKLHKLTVVTRNVGDFSNFDVEVLNPFEYQGR